MAFELRPNPDFSWSNSRMELLRDCKRAYYYQYYGSHNGWCKNTDYDTWRAYSLKQTIPLKIAFADGVQNAICRFFDAPDTIGYAEFQEIIGKRLHDVCKIKRAQWEHQPKRNPIVLELLNYEEGFKNDRVMKVISDIKAQFGVVTENFFNSKTVNEVIDGAELIENYEHFDYSGFFLLKGKKNEIVIWGKPDTVHVLNGKYIATVWKTGLKEKDGHNEELHADIIATYIAKKYNQPFSNIEVRVANIQRGITRTYEIKSKEQYVAVLKSIGEGVKEMATLVEGKDIIANKALPIESFPQKDDHRKCRQCRFCMMCKEQSKNDAAPIKEQPELSILNIELEEKKNGAYVQSPRDTTAPQNRAC